MRLLIIGDYSNYSVTLAGALRALGHEVTLMSDGCRWMGTHRDIDITRRAGKLGGLMLWTRLLTTLAPAMRGHDAVLLNTPLAVDLKPSRNMALMRRLKALNKKVFVMATGDDPLIVREFSRTDEPLLRYTDWLMPDGSAAPRARLADAELAEWLRPDMLDHARNCYNIADGALTALYEYHRACERFVDPDKLTYAGIPVDVDAIKPVNMEECRTGPVRIFLGRHADRIALKGTDLLEAAARRVVDRHRDRAQLIIVENRPYDEYITLLDSAHIVLDQVYSYTPATNALMAMARGQSVVSGGEPEYYDFIGEKDNRPILNGLPDVDQLTALIETEVLDPGRLAGRAAANREFVRRHNDAPIVAQRVLDAICNHQNDSDLCLK